MQRPRRRAVLARLSTVGFAGIAGCSEQLSDDETPETTPPTETPPETATASLEALSYAAEVVEQPSESAPATIRTELRNEGDSLARFGARETVVLRYDEGPGGRLLCFPDTDVGPNDPPTEPTDGCWRYTDEDFLARDIQEWHDVEPGGAFVETYRLFTWDEDTPCLPEGDHRFSADIDGRDGGRMDLTLTVSVADGTVSVEASQEVV